MFLRVRALVEALVERLRVPDALVLAQDDAVAAALAPCVFW